MEINNFIIVTQNLSISGANKVLINLIKGNIWDGNIIHITIGW